MTKKILIAVGNEFLSRIYIDFFREKEFSVLTEGTISSILKNIPDIILLDIIWAAKDDFKTLKELKINSITNKIPIILLSHSDDKTYREKAIAFEVKDYLIGDYNSPLTIFSRIITHLEGEKSFQIPLNIEETRVKNLAEELGYYDLICDQCSTNMILNLMRDTSKGKNYFKLSFVCPVCGAQKDEEIKNQD